MVTEGRARTPGPAYPDAMTSRPAANRPALQAADRDRPGRDPRLPGFAKDGEWDAPAVGALAVALEAASGTEWRCPGATRDEMLGLLRQWQALEAWAAAGKLGRAAGADPRRRPAAAGRWLPR